MKKMYTKRQITEAIAYWKKQLKDGNYKRVDESGDSSRTLGYLLDKAKQLDPSMLNKDFVVLVDNRMVQSIARDVCKALGVKWDNSTYDKLENATWGTHTYSYGMSDLSIVEFKGDAVVTGFPEWTDILPA